MVKLPKMSDLGMNNWSQSTVETQLIARLAQPEDAMDILRWRNDPFVCAMSRHHKPISEVAHMAWYSRVVNDPNRLLLIGVLEDQKVGIVRFNHERASLWEVSIVIAPEARGQGVGRHLLEMALKRLNITHAPSSVLAVVRLNNKPSLRLFHALGFTRESNDDEFVSLVLPSNDNAPASFVPTK
jgi:ribosomal protein S18 acetylase RimI-like enzyme